MRADQGLRGARKCEAVSGGAKSRAVGLLMDVNTRVSGLAVSIGVVVALVATLTAGVPRTLPDIAIGSGVLLHAERVLGFVLGYVVLLVVVTRSWSGQLPTQVSTQGLTYTAGETNVITSEGIDSLAAEVKSLRVRIERLEAGVR
jgi:hypothetical protein